MNSVKLIILKAIYQDTENREVLLDWIGFEYYHV